MSQDVSALIEKDAKYVLHPASSIPALIENGPQMIVSAKGCHITDADGNELLDAVAGLWCVNAGYGRPELAEAMKTSAEQLGYYHSFANASNPWQVELAEKLIAHAPDGLSKVFFGSSGSDCNDTLIKIAWHYHSLQGNTSKIKIIARDQAYHGTSISTASLTGLPGFHKDFPIPLDFVLRTDCPHYYSHGLPDETEEEFCDRLINNVAELIEKEGADNIAAFFAEPVMGAGGIIVPPEDYYPKLKRLLTRYNILLIADEVICGFGRLGAWFGSPQLGLEPDMMATAKGITSGYFPMSAAFISESIWDVLKIGSEKIGAFMHGYTYSGHPVGAAVALANINIIEKENLVSQAAANGQYLHEQLQSLMNLPSVGEIRGQGLIAGIQLVSDKHSKELHDASLKIPLKVANLVKEKGVIVRPLPTVGTLAISPPLTISKSEIDTLVQALTDSISSLG
ncbi:MAG: aminotransferase class III-fold pyridoxal phosphate-dependent enzyme [Pseudomonadales bacterium]|nr:aminotransferase class III-fold pyridoxal phosphate-dependent enzyme [Pseudomonadales bacterium]